MIEIFDDVFLEREKEIIEQFLTSNTFPWYVYGNYTVIDEHYHKLKTENTREYFQFSHYFYSKEHKETHGYKNSPYFYPVEKLLKKFSIDDILRAKANFQPKVESFKEDEHNTPHIDFPFPHKVLLYYVNESDGNTFFFDKNKNVTKRVEHKKGRCVLFDGSILHSGAHPSKTDKRITINISYITNKTLNNIFLL